MGLDLTESALIYNNGSRSYCSSRPTLFQIFNFKHIVGVSYIIKEIPEGKKFIAALSLLKEVPFEIGLLKK